MDAPDDAEPAGIRAILRRPEAVAHYQRLRRTHWVESFLASGDPIYRRLGMKLLTREIVDLVDPSFSRDHWYEEPLGNGKRRRQPTTRGTCARCGASVALRRADGMIRQHGTATADCPGTGALPAVPAADGSLVIRPGAPPPAEEPAAPPTPPVTEEPLERVELDEAPDTVRDPSPATVAAWKWFKTNGLKERVSEVWRDREAAAVARAARTAARKVAREARIAAYARVKIARRP